MLKKIIKLENVGLFRSGTPKPVLLDRLTLVYGENGRGKSTLSAVLRSCAIGNGTKLLKKKTLDVDAEMEVSMLFEIDEKKTPVNFSKNEWDKCVPNVVVFDSDFVEQNVFSGQEVRSEQRKELLDFALGNEAVDLKQKINDLTRQISEARHRSSDAEKTIKQYSKQTSVKQFIDLTPIPEAKQQINSLRKLIEANRSMDSLLKRQDPQILGMIEFETESFFDIINKTLNDLQEDAEVIVNGHFANHATMPGIEDWISRGQEFASKEDCPFCGQALSGSSLIGAYKSYFNEIYADLKGRVALLQGEAEERLSNEKIEVLAPKVDTNTARIEAWKDQMEIEAPLLNLESLKVEIQDARELAVELASSKQRRPLEKAGSESVRLLISNAIAKVNKELHEYNQKLILVTSKITDFKKTLSIDNISNLERQIQELELSIVRYETETVMAIGEYVTANTEREKLDDEKSETRNQLDVLMKKTLTQYQSKINDILRRFGASFTIESLKPNYAGSGEPRSEYMIQLRQKSVRLGDRNEAGPNFGSLLSEADKRTLAFAFFLARIEADTGNMKSQIIVLDDPVSSLDVNRRSQTLNLIASLVTRCAQVIVLSHDAYFVKDLREKVTKAKSIQDSIQIVAIKRVKDDYSEFTDCDIDKICASDYYRHYTHVSDYVSGAYQGDIRDVAKSLRPLLEGYYHRRFPKLLPNAMFGKIIEKISEADQTSPLVHLQSSIGAISEVNEYTSSFHHDTSAGFDKADVTDSELRYYAKKVLDLIYKG